MADRNYNTVAVDIEVFVAESKERMLAVVRSSLQDVVEVAQKTTDKGGRMRYKTGFLSWSGRASIDGWPSGPNIRPKDAVDGQYTWNGDAVNTVLRSLDIGDTFFYGWTAAYAPVREVYDGFLEAAIQQWPQIVNANTEKLRSRING